MSIKLYPEILLHFMDKLLLIVVNGKATSFYEMLLCGPTNVLVGYFPKVLLPRFLVRNFESNFVVVGEVLASRPLSGHEWKTAKCLALIKSNSTKERLALVKKSEAIFRARANAIMSRSFTPLLLEPEFFLML